MEAIKLMEKDIKGKMLNLSVLDKDKTVLIIIDMVNGFVYDGSLSSSRVAGIVKNIVELNEKTGKIKKVFFIDSHDKNSSEFKNFPVHCVNDTEEALLIPELTVYANDENSVCIRKNSTNGFNNNIFREWFLNNIGEIDNYIVTGCVTDICVLQFTLSLKAFLNDENKSKRVIVPVNCVETYDGGSHDGDLMNLFALYNMHTSGVEIVEKID